MILCNADDALDVSGGGVGTGDGLGSGLRGFTDTFGAACSFRECKVEKSELVLKGSGDVSPATTLLPTPNATESN